MHPSLPVCLDFHLKNAHLLQTLAKGYFHHLIKPEDVVGWYTLYILYMYYEVQLHGGLH